ncbi:DUF3558 domain-containing protein [Amycolatopsis cihanbeyliensis]|uniref:Uncharacterized protein DUF3558 n=1 Tax=Amycolatopsis cihanbeyliensis TaxID=1128664 RepID=A0A542DMD4_AMYCI|nr:DUF3558 domain-containing protein [Amycolatopsis cihanbeyliensis]TQJ04145.1 uncharacterized protein DUF3558 [Amycolatopsis cihanbeyliensis]
MLAASAALSLVMLAGCDSGEAGQALPTSGAEVSTTQSEPAGGREFTKAPPVQDPLDASKYIQDPCSSLTESQQQEFNVTSSRENSDEDNSRCRWNIGDGSTSPGVSYATGIEEGLDRLYALNDTGHWDKGYFEPTEIAGYPAVYVEIVDNRGPGDCNLAVAISDNLFFNSTVRTHGDGDACQAAENVAKAVIETIKAGN